MNRIFEIIEKHQIEEFNKLSKERTKLLVHQVLNKVYKGKPIKVDNAFIQTLDEIIELNALEFAILKKNEIFTFKILRFIKQNTCSTQYLDFLNHSWSKNKSYHAFHIATFFGFSDLAHHLRTTLQESIPHRINPTFLLKKAENQLARLSPPIILSLHSPLSFSSSTSTTSSTASTDQLMWTPPHLSKPRLSLQKENNTSIVSPKKVRFDPVSLVFDACRAGDVDELLHGWMTLTNIASLKDHKNRSLLHIALMYGHEHLVEHIYEKVDINQSDDDGWTCLHYASALGLWKTIQFLGKLDQCDLEATTHLGLKIEDCPESEVHKKKCKIIKSKLIQLQKKKNRKSF